MCCFHWSSFPSQSWGLFFSLRSTTTLPKSCVIKRFYTLKRLVSQTTLRQPKSVILFVSSRVTLKTSSTSAFPVVASSSWQRQKIHRSKSGISKVSDVLSGHEAEIGAALWSHPGGQVIVGGVSRHWGGGFHGGATHVSYVTARRLFHSLTVTELLFTRMATINGGFAALFRNTWRSLTLRNRASKVWHCICCLWNIHSSVFHFTLQERYWAQWTRTRWTTRTRLFLRAADSSLPQVGVPSQQKSIEPWDSFAHCIEPHFIAHCLASRKSESQTGKWWQVACNLGRNWLFYLSEGA